MGERVSAACFHDLVHVHKHQLTLRDARAEWQDWQEGFLDIGVGVFPGGVTIFTKRANGAVPVTIELLSGAPPDADRAIYSSAKRASIAVADHLQVTPLDGLPIDLAIGAGAYGVLLLTGNADTATYDGSVGCDFYRICLWPEEPEEAAAEPELLWARPAGERRTPEPRLTLDEARALSLRDDVHARFAAMVDLARHNSPLFIVMGDEQPSTTVEHVMLGCFELMRPLQPQLLQGRIRDLRPELIPSLLSSLEGHIDIVCETRVEGKDPVCDLRQLYYLLGRAFQLLTGSAKATVYKQLRAFQELVETIRYDGVEYPGEDGPYFFDRR